MNNEVDTKHGLEAFSEVKRAIVVCAHADDTETMIGGTTLILAQQGVFFCQLICTRGDLGSNEESFTRDSLAAARFDEAQSGAGRLGIQETIVLGHPDGELQATLELRAQIAEHYRRWQPDALFTFDPYWPGQIHPDHRAVGTAAIEALMPSKMRLYRPEQLSATQVANITQAFFFSPANPGIFVDVTDVYAQKVEASLAHKSQFPGGDSSLDWMRQLDSDAAKRAGLEGRLVEQFGALRVW